MGDQVVKWADLTSVELGALDRSIPIVMNVAAIEQHGGHLPVGTDAMIGAHFCDRLNASLPDDVLIMPQLAVCCSSHHMDFAGTLTVRHETMLAYVADVFESALAHGFTNVVMLNSHGGNEAIGRVIVEKLGYANPQAQIAMLTWWTLAREALSDIQESGFGGVGHACEFETSLLMHFAPDAVRGKRIADPEMPSTYEWARGDMLNGAAAVLYRTMKTQSGGTGTVGRPSFASADKGARISQAVMDRLVVAMSNLRHGKGA